MSPAEILNKDVTLPFFHLQPGRHENHSSTS
jgi:hypothetical protein